MLLFIYPLQKDKTGEADKFHSVSRGCANKCDDLNLIIHKKTCCDTDLCNGANSFWTYSPLLFFLSLLVYFYHK